MLISLCLYCLGDHAITMNRYPSQLVGHHGDSVPSTVSSLKAGWDPPGAGVSFQPSLPRALGGQPGPGIGVPTATGEAARVPWDLLGQLGSRGTAQGNSPPWDALFIGTTV